EAHAAGRERADRVQLGSEPAHLPRAFEHFVGRRARRGLDLVLPHVGRVQSDVELAEGKLRQTVVGRKVHAADIDAAQVGGRLDHADDLAGVRTALYTGDQRAEHGVAAETLVHHRLHADAGDRVVEINPPQVHARGQARN